MYEVSLLSMMANNGSKTNTCGFEFLTNQSSVGEEWRCEARVSNPVYGRSKSIIYELAHC